MSRMTKPLLAVVAAMLLAALLTCAGNAPANRTGTAAKTDYFTGDGGKGRSITILPPRGVGLAANQAYLPDFVANELVSNFGSFSAMTLFDRVNNQKQYDELLSGFYADDDKAGLDLGHLSSTDYMLLGDITKTSTGFALQLTVNRNSDKTTVASYSQTLSIAELDNLTGVRRASLDLLQKMGVQVTERTRTELTGAATAERVNAQTALARGIVAQRQGNTVETMARFYEAASIDPSFAEALSRANTMSATVRTGSLGENFRNDLAWRDEWREILDDARIYLQSNPPPAMACVIYNPNLKKGRLNYEEGKAVFSFSYRVRGLPYPQNYRRMIADINGGLNATKRNIYWRLTLLSPKNIWGTEHYGPYGNDYLASEIGTIRIDADLSNSSGRYVSSAISTSVLWDYLWGGVLYVDKFNTKIGIGYLTDFLPDLLSWSSVSGRGAFEVDAKDITDQMTIRITANLQDTTSDYHRTLISGSSYKILTVTETEYRALSRR